MRHPSILNNKQEKSLAIIEANCQIGAVELTGVIGVKFMDIMAPKDGPCQRTILISLENGAEFRLKLIADDRSALGVKITKPFEV